MDISLLLARYGRQVPRYTSYPTAVQFRPMQEAPYRARLARLTNDARVSLYLHIPFCPSLCHYCGCHTEITRCPAPLAEYVAQLTREIAQVAAQIGQRIAVSRIHFGGGTPNYLSTPQLTHLLETLAQHFTVDAETNIDMECDPRLLDAEKITAYAALGVRRISLGIQDFDARVQQTIHRVQPHAKVAEIVRELRSAGLNDINFDLILGLPEQTLASVEATLAQVIALRPSRIAVFPYAHVPWVKPQQKLLERFTLPDASMRHAMGVLVAERLVAAGYEAIGMDHFALPEDALARLQQQGKLRRNFQGYTDDMAETILGFGSSAISQFPDLFVQNMTDRKAYAAAIAAQQLPVACGCQLTADDQVRGALIERLLCDFTIDWAEYGVEPDAARIAALVADGVILCEGTRLTITQEGKALARIVAALFDTYYRVDSGYHAQAV